MSKDVCGTFEVEAMTDDIAWSMNQLEKTGKMTAYRYYYNGFSSKAYKTRAAAKAQLAKHRARGLSPEFLKRRLG